MGFREIDWVYCLNRARRQTPYRYAEATDALRTLATRYLSSLVDRIQTLPTPFPDLHTLFGCLCALAELQRALPGQLRSARPLRLVLDRRPFI